MKLFRYTCPDNKDIYHAFDADGDVVWTIHYGDGRWVLTNQNGYDYDDSPNLDTLLDKWKNEFTL